MKVLGKILHRVDIAADSAWGVVATLEFIQHQLSNMGHGKHPVTHTLHRQEHYSKQTPQRPSRQRLSSNAVGYEIENWSMLFATAIGGRFYRSEEHTSE